MERTKNQRKEILTSKLQTLFNEAMSDHRYTDASIIMTWIYECDYCAPLASDCVNAMIGVSFNFSVLYTGPMWMRMRHYYFPYNQNQLNFRRVVLLIPLGTNEKPPNPRISVTLLQAAGLYAIYHKILKLWGASKP